MSRRKLRVNREKFEQAVQEAEAKGPLKNISHLCNAVSKIYNGMDVPEDLNPQVVGLRLKEYNLNIKTKRESRGRKSTVNASIVAEKPAEKPAEKTVEKTAKKIISKQADSDSDEKSSNSSRMLNVCTPSGKCPIKLTGTGKQDVREWAQAVVEFGYTQNKNYTHDAIKYFVRHCYDIFSEEWKTVIGHLDFWLQEEKI
jgi:hypothetical protein